MASQDKCDSFERRVEALELLSNERHDSATRAVIDLRNDLSDHVKVQLKQEEINCERHDDLLVSIQRLTDSLETQAQATAGLVEIVTTGRTLGKFGKWISSVAIFGAAIAWFADNING